MKLANPPDPQGLGLLCKHLAAYDDLDEYGRYYLGGTQYGLVCPACMAAFREKEKLPTLVSVAADVLESLESSMCDGVIGAPTFTTRPTSLRFESKDYRCDFDLVAVHGADSQWLGLSHDAEVVDLLHNRSLCRLSQGTIDYDQRIDLYRSSDLLVVVNSLGQFGRVYSLADGQPVLELDRGDYHPEVSRFPIALVHDGSRPLLVHANAWNDLQVTDLRAKQPWHESKVESTLDYFHASLSVSPGEGWIVSNGWSWHPMGCLRSWSLEDWLRSNPLEPENGASLKLLCYRDSFWDGPLCWINETTLAVWGHGDDSLWMTPAVLFFDARSGERLGWFPGPAIGNHELFAGVPSKNSRLISQGFLAFDGHLHAVSPTEGSSVWDIATGEQLLHDPDHRPVAYSHGQFLSLEKGQVVTSHLVGRSSE